MSAAEKTWATMSWDERFQLLGEPLKDEEREPLMARVRAYIDERPRRARDPQFCINVVVREVWRHDHGSTAEWDRAARAAGWFL